MNNNNPDPHLIQLNFLIGKWRTKGDVSEVGTSPAMKISGSDTYEWALGDRFILHRADVMMGDQKTEVIEMIGGLDENTYDFHMRSFDNLGNFTTMKARIISKGVLQITEDKMRSVLTMKDSDTMTAQWEISEDGYKWQPWMSLDFTKLVK